MKQAKFFVGGLETEGAAQSVENELKAVDGVEGVDASHEAEQIAVRYDVDETSSGDLRRVIEQAGYEVG